MLDPVYVRDHLAEVEARLRQRGLDPAKELAELAGLEAERRRLIPAVENLKREQNAAGEAGRAREEGGTRPERDLCREQGARGTHPRS